MLSCFVRIFFMNKGPKKCIDFWYCWVSNLHLSYTPFQTFFIHLDPLSHQYHCIINCKRASKMVFNYVLCLLFDLDFCSFSYGILSLSAAILLKSILQVSLGKSSHMGKLEMTWIWTESYWLSRIHQRRPWSKVFKRWST